MTPIRRFRLWQMNRLIRRGFAVVGFFPTAMGVPPVPSNPWQYPDRAPIVERHADVNRLNPYESENILGWARRHKFNGTFVAYRVSKPSGLWPPDTSWSGDWRPTDGSLTLKAFCPILNAGFGVKR